MKKFMFIALNLIAFINAGNEVNTITKSAGDLPATKATAATKYILSQDNLADSIFTDQFSNRKACAAAAKQTWAPTVCEETGADVDTLDVAD